MIAIAETPVVIGPTGLTGIISQPAQGRCARPGIILVSAGSTHRSGPNRVYTRLARQLAGRGYCCCRFDLAGIGDSPARTGGAFREGARHELTGVMDTLADTTGNDRFVLLGLCSGADVALDAAAEDPGVVGLVLINGALVTGDRFAELYHAAEARTLRRLYRKRLWSPYAWARLLSGRSGFWRRLRTRAGEKPRPRSNRAGGGFGLRPDSRFHALAARGVDIFLLYSEGSVFRDVYAMALKASLSRSYPQNRLRVATYKHVDHTFTLLSAQQRLASDVLDWLESGHDGQKEGLK